jgi:hypothetical protein
MQYCSTSRGLLLGGKIVRGAGVGAAMATATAYASEVGSKFAFQSDFG